MTRIRVYVVSLGCPKNLVDTELMMGHLASAGMDFIDDPEIADIILINTCGFLQEAREESLDTIFELAALNPSVLAVTGCLAERYREELVREIPEIDVLLGVTGQEEIAALAAKALARTDREIGLLHDSRGKGIVLSAGRVLATPPHTAYLRISEGCDLTCSFCVIPRIRGSQKDRPMEEIVEEARALAERGTLEISVIAQDTARYGIERYGEACLPKLLQELATVDGLRWIRVFYVNPLGVTPELVRTIADSDRILKYLDMPIQHASDRILRAMRRGETKKTLVEKIALLLEWIPEIALRTTVLVGFPGETDQEFQELMDFLTDADFEHVGVFAFSKEEGTPAAEMPNQVDEETKTHRHLAMLHHLDKLARRAMARHLDTRAEAIIDGPSEIYPDFMKGRTWRQGIDIDGVTYVTGRGAKAGRIVPIRIFDYKDQDFFAEVEK